MCSDKREFVLLRTHELTLKDGKYCNYLLLAILHVYFLNLGGDFTLGPEFLISP